METMFNAPEIINSLPITDGNLRGNWRTERVFLAKKICLGCGITYFPWVKYSEPGKLKSAQAEPSWKKQNFCSVKCAKKFCPTILNAQAKAKIKQTLKDMKHRPIQRGGNGQLLPLPQIALLHALGMGWIAEHPIKTYAGHLNGIYPNAYKVDIANLEKMIAIELDGGTHSSIERQNQDKKKDQCLAALGWSVYRVSNQKALNLYSTFKSVDTLLISLMA